MKLFAFHPNGHGDVSFFVNAKNEDQARARVELRILEAKKSGGDLEAWGIARSEQGWRTPGRYTVSIHEVGQVAINDNS